MISNVIKVSSLFDENVPCLDINNPTVDNYNAIAFQVKGNLSFDYKKGPQYSDEFLENKARSFVTIAKDTNASLVLTPECSIQASLIDEIISDNNKWPNAGKLWCLCATGISNGDYDSMCLRYESYETISLHRSNINTNKKYINSLWYLFRISQNELCVIVQLKMASSFDSSHTGEDLGMTTGDTLYLFDLGKDNIYSQLFASLICSDAIGQSINSLLNFASSSSLFIFNPQFNPKPRAASFQGFRTTFFSDLNIKNPSMIVLNWSDNSSIENNFKIDDGSGSSIIIGSNRTIFHARELFRNRKINSTKGLYFFYDDDRHIDFWKLHNDEKVLKFMLKNSSSYGTNSHLFPPFSVLSESIYYFNYDQQEWVECNIAICDYSFEDKITKSNNYPLPYICRRNEACCCVNHGCNLVYCDFFFALCFGDYKKDQINMEKEVGKKITNALDPDSIINQRKSIKLFEKLRQLLEENTFPDTLKSIYSNNNRFEIDPNAAETGSNQLYNLCPVTGERRIRALVSIFDSSDKEGVIEPSYDTLFRATHEDYRDQIIIYYRDPITDLFIPYSYPHMQTSIKNPQMTIPPSKIMSLR